MRETKLNTHSVNETQVWLWLNFTCVLLRGLSLLSAGERRIGARTGATSAAAQGPGTHCCGAVSGLPSSSRAVGPGPGDGMALSLSFS